MAAQTFAQIMITFMAIATGFSLFLNFLLLLMDEAKKYSIIDRKKKSCFAWIPAEGMAPGRIRGQ